MVQQQFASNIIINVVFHRSHSYIASTQSKCCGRCSRKRAPFCDCDNQMSLRTRTCEVPPAELGRTSDRSGIVIRIVTIEWGRASVSCLLVAAFDRTMLLSHFHGQASNLTISSSIQSAICRGLEALMATCTSRGCLPYTSKHLQLIQQEMILCDHLIVSCYDNSISKYVGWLRLEGAA
jgi:hypothetical protein